MSLCACARSLRQLPERGAEVVLTAARAGGAAVLAYADEAFWTKSRALAAVECAPFGLEYCGEWCANHEVRVLTSYGAALREFKMHSMC